MLAFVFGARRYCRLQVPRAILDMDAFATVCAVLGRL